MRYIISALIISLFAYNLFTQDKLPDAANLPNQVGDTIFTPVSCTSKNGYHRADPYKEEPDQVYLSDITEALAKAKR